MYTDSKRAGLHAARFQLCQRQRHLSKAGENPRTGSCKLREKQKTRDPPDVHAHRKARAGGAPAATGSSS